MLSQKILNSCNFAKHLLKNGAFVINHSSQRYVNVSVVGAANDVGSSLALLLKQNHDIQKLSLYDTDVKVKGIGLELSYIPGGPEVNAWTGDTALEDAICDADVIVMVYRVPRKPGFTREQMIAVNAPAVQKLCRAIASQNPGAFLAIATNPLNSMVPFASALMYKYGGYNPFKILGITHLDMARARVLTAQAFSINPLDVSLPVIGGHSDETIVPVFSSMIPSSISLEPTKAETLTRIIRDAGTEVIFQKHGKDSATLGLAAAVNEFVTLLIDAVKGNEVIVNSYTANTSFGTRFFSGPTKVGPHGIIEPCSSFQLNDYESILMNTAVTLLNRDVGLGEDYIRYIEAGRF